MIVEAKHQQAYSGTPQSQHRLTFFEYYEGLAAEAEATIDTYLNSAVGIGEHPQVMQELRKQIEILGEARDGIDTIITLQNRNKPKTQLNG